MKASTKLLTYAIIALVLGIGGGIGIGFLIQPKSSQTYDLRYGGQYYPGEFLLKGMPEFWTKYGLNVDHRIFASGGENNNAMIAGEVDINCGSDSKTVGLFSSIDNALIIGTIQRGDRYSTIVTDTATYSSWFDLVGETVALPFGTGAEQVVGRYFDTEPTLDWDNFTWLDLPVTQLVSALDSGQIKAFTAWEHTPSVAVSQGVGEVMMSYGSYAMTPASLHTTTDFAYANPQKIIAFLAGHFEKYNMIMTNKTGAAKIASQAAATLSVNISAAAYELIFDKINFQIDFNETVIAAINNTASFLYSKGKIDSIPELVWDTRFVEAAKELYENYGTPSTGFSAKAFQEGLIKVTEKYFCVESYQTLALGLFSCTFGSIIVLTARRKLRS